MANSLSRAYRKHFRHTSRSAFSVASCQACGHRVRGKAHINAEYTRICSVCNRSFNS